MIDLEDDYSEARAWVRIFLRTERVNRSVRARIRQAFTSECCLRILRNSRECPNDLLAIAVLYQKGYTASARAKFTRRERSIRANIWGCLTFARKERQRLVLAVRLLLEGLSEDDLSHMAHYHGMNFEYKDQKTFLQSWTPKSD
jgi:hypothetical protein